MNLSNLLMSCGDTPDFAPFYVTRAEILAGNNDLQCESDLKKALSIDNEMEVSAEAC